MDSSVDLPAGPPLPAAATRRRPYGVWAHQVKRMTVDGPSSPVLST